MRTLLYTKTGISTIPHRFVLKDIKWHTNKHMEIKVVSDV